MTLSGTETLNHPVSRRLSRATEAVTRPTRETLSVRNTALDCLFYDVTNLTAAERARLTLETTSEGSILVVWPTGAKGDEGIMRFSDYIALRRAPGRALQRFTIAGVGSSDLGAASFARTFADHFDEPVGAIVAGYGAADLLAEALGGWFVMGAANRLRQRYQAFLEAGPVPGKRATSAFAAGTAPLDAVEGQEDSATLLRLLQDEDRQVLSIGGHSKGCLSMAYALEGLTFAGDGAAVARARDAQLVTTGAVVALPAGYTKVMQFLGGIDGFGALNSRFGLNPVLVPWAWHHLNTALPNHMNLGALLAEHGL